MFRGRKIVQIALILAIGTLGYFTPLLVRSGVTAINHIASADEQITAEPVGQKYHFVLEDGSLSVVQGESGIDGPVMMQGLDTHNWNPEIMEMAQKAEFSSLDEVQSFIDSVEETRGQE